MPHGCRVAAEIGTLLRSGFPEGAAARGRTLHELAVVSFVIKDASPDVGERFLLHDGVGRCKDAESYFANQAALGLEPLEISELEALRAVTNPVRKQIGYAA